MKKRMISILICVCMALTMMPAATLTAWATDPAPVTELWVGSTQVVQSGTVPADASGTGWNYDAATATLTLDGANITTIAHDGVTGESGSMDYYYYYGIFCYGDLNIVVTGDSTIDARATVFKSSGIYIHGNLSVSGSAELTAKGNWRGLWVAENLILSGDVTLSGIAESTSLNTINGVYIENSITVSDTANLIGIAEGGQTRTNGIMCMKGRITIDSGATMTGKLEGTNYNSAMNAGVAAGTSTFTSYDSGEVLVEGTLVAEAGNATEHGSVAGLYLFKTNVIISGNGSIVAKSGDLGDNSSTSYGVNVGSDATITINAGGFLASGETCAVYPATTGITLSGTPVYYEVSTNRDGSGATVCTDTDTWNSTYNGNFGAYKYINATTLYEVYINGTQVTRVNRHDVLGDGTVSYLPASGSDPAQLTLNGASLTSVQLDGDAELSLAGTNTVGTITNAGEVTVSGSGGLTLTGSLDCGSENLTVESGATLTLQGTVTSDELVNNGTLVSNNTAPMTLSKLTNNGSFSNTGAGSLTVDTITGSGIITNEGTLILPSSVEEETAERITGEGLTEVRGEGADPSVYYTNGTRLISAPGAMDFTTTAESGGWSESAALETNGYTWNADTKTLTLQNLLAQISGDHAITVSSGTAVAVEGINILSSSDGAGIYGDGILTIQGDGTLRASGNNGGLLADQIKVTGNVDATVNGIDNSSKPEPSVEVSGNASLTGTKSIKTGSYHQSGSVSVSVNGNSLHGIMTAGELRVDGGTLTVSSDIAAVMAEGGILLGSGRGVLTPSGGKIAAAEVTIGGITHTYTTILPSGENTHTAELAGSMINSNGARNVVIGAAPVTPGSGGGGGGSTAGDTATVSLTDAQLNEITAGSSGSQNFSIDASKLGSNAVVIPTKIVSAVNGSSDNKGLEVIMPAGTVILDKTALAAVSGKGDVKLSIETVTSDKLSESQKTALGTQIGSAVIVDVNIEVNGIKTGTFDGGKLEIAVPYTLKPGENADSITVWFIKDDGTIEPKNGVYNAATGRVEFTTDHLSQYLIVNFPFADVAEKAWYYGSVAYAYNNGLFSGTSETSFTPGAAMTRQMIWMVLTRMDGKNPANMAEAKAWAVENKISDGSNPNNEITRGQMAAILYRYAQYKGYDTTQGGMAIREFADYDGIPAYAMEALGWTVNTGLMQGSGGKLMPKGNATRAQVAAILQRFDQNVAK